MGDNADTSEKRPAKESSSICSVFGCTTKKRTPGVHWYRFPKANFLTHRRERREHWIKLVSLKSGYGSDWVPNDSSKICSAHFINNKKSEDPKSPSYNPSIFPEIYRKTKIPANAAINGYNLSLRCDDRCKQSKNASYKTKDTKISSVNNELVTPKINNELGGFSCKTKSINVSSNDDKVEKIFHNKSMEGTDSLFRFICVPTKEDFLAKNDEESINKKRKKNSDTNYKILGLQNSSTSNVLERMSQCNNKNLDSNASAPTFKDVSIQQDFLEEDNENSLNIFYCSKYILPATCDAETQACIPLLKQKKHSRNHLQQNKEKFQGFHSIYIKEEPGLLESRDETIKFI